MTEDDLWNNMPKNIYDASYKILPKPLPRAWVKKSSYHQPIVREWSERSNEGEEQTEDGDSKRFHQKYKKKKKSLAILTGIVDHNRSECEYELEEEQSVRKEHSGERTFNA
uniref:Ovule protein n=1 Tax=Ascaris lumbricoides TaxID=6252 RepID=A0A0M3HW36_ASCLU